MQGEKVKVKLALTVLILAIFWGINTSAAVINQWMAKNVAPQPFAISRQSDGVILELLGYGVELNKTKLKTMTGNISSDFETFADYGVSLFNQMMPEVNQITQELLAKSKTIYKKAYNLGQSYLNELETLRQPPK